MSIQCFCCHINKGNFKGWIVRIWQMKSSSSRKIEKLWDFIHFLVIPTKNLCQKRHFWSFLDWSKSGLGWLLLLFVQKLLKSFGLLPLFSTSCCQFSVISWLYVLLSSIHKKIFVGVGSQALEQPLEVHTNCNTGCSTICKVEKLLQIIS